MAQILLLLCLLFPSKQPVPSNNADTKWVFVGYRISEKVKGCNDRFAKYGYVWIYKDEKFSANLDLLKAEIKKNHPGVFTLTHMHAAWQGNAIALVENNNYCISLKETVPSYTFFSGKDLDSVKEQAEKNKKNSTDVRSYNFVKVLDFKEETAKLEKQSKKVVIGEHN